MSETTVSTATAPSTEPIVPQIYVRPTGTPRDSESDLSCPSGYILVTQASVSLHRSKIPSLTDEFIATDTISILDEATGQSTLFTVPKTCLIERPNYVKPTQVMCNNASDREDIKDCNTSAYTDSSHQKFVLRCPGPNFTLTDLDKVTGASEIPNYAPLTIVLQVVDSSSVTTGESEESHTFACHNDLASGDSGRSDLP